MKRMVSLALALLICFSLCACGAESQEDVAGTYWYVSGIDRADSIWLHDDYTYDRGFEKGTYKVERNKIYLHRDNSSNSTTTLVKQGDVYYIESSNFGPSFEPMKNEYGQTVTFSKEGRIDHTFSWSNYSDIDHLRAYDLVLCSDGTFTLEELAVKNGDALNAESNIKEGTYTFENSLLTLIGDDFACYLVCTEEGITRNVYKKYSANEMKENLLGKWTNEWEVEELPSYEFLEDGTLMRYHTSGDTTYTYEVTADGSITCVGSEGSDTITIAYRIEDGRMELIINEPWFMDPWVPLVKK